MSPQVFHGGTRLGCLRELMALEPELEQKAACVLVMGAAAEKKQDFEAAVRFYREALAMEPICNDVWYFIHNNLGYSADKCRSSLPTLY